MTRPPPRMRFSSALIVEKRTVPASVPTVANDLFYYISLAIPPRILTTFAASRLPFWIIGKVKGLASDRA